MKWYIRAVLDGTAWRVDSDTLCPGCKEQHLQTIVMPRVKVAQMVQFCPRCEAFLEYVPLPPEWPIFDNYEDLPRPGSTSSRRSDGVKSQSFFVTGSQVWNVISLLAEWYPKALTDSEIALMMGGGESEQSFHGLLRVANFPRLEGWGNVSQAKFQGGRFVIATRLSDAAVGYLRENLGVDIEVDPDADAPLTRLGFDKHYEEMRARVKENKLRRARGQALLPIPKAMKNPPLWSGRRLWSTTDEGAA